MWKDSETELDFLDFDYLIGVLKDTIDNDELLPSSIGVYGDWGSGKSSLIKMSMNSLKDDEDNVCLVFNGWLFEGYEDAKTALIGSILDSIQENRKFSEKARLCLSGLYKSIDKFKLLKSGFKYGIDIMTTGGIGTIANMTLNSIASKISNQAEEAEFEKIKNTISDELNNKSIRDDIREFRKNFESLLEETHIKRLIVFIDELDRCSPDTILETLEAIRLFLFVGNVVFIIGADERHISYAVKKRFAEIEGIQIDIGKEYLEKMIQYPIRIPRLNTREVEFYITCLLFQKDLTQNEFDEMIEFLKNEKNKDFINFSISYESIKKGLPNLADSVKESIIIGKQLASVLASGLNGNPRHCKRFLNSLVMREKMAEYKKIKLDRSILAKIMMLEYFKLPLFKKIAQLQFSNKGAKEELDALENDALTEQNELRIWKDDAWVVEWAKRDPKLSDIDLTPYFYFTRTSLSEKFNTGIIKLSPKAQEILNKLLSKSDFSINAALKSATEINEYESGEILETLFTKMITESIIDNNLFKAYIKWGLTKECLFTNVISNLKSLPGEKIRIPFIPLIKEFAKESNKKDEIEEIIDNWSKSNEKISKMRRKH